MTLDVLQGEMIAAMKNKDKERKDVLSSIIQAVKKFGIDNMCKDNISEEQIDAVILKEKKTVQEMIDTCPADREELMRGYRAKMAIIDEFAPQIMTDEAEIIAFVEATGIELVKANRGAVMKALKGKADMKVANAVVGKILK
jgi:uncharacterized protein YqeY